MGMLISAKYDGEMLRYVLEIAKYYRRFRLYLKSDYPLVVETEDFWFLLAPCVEENPHNKNPCHFNRL
jgi:hypothetical protein